MSIIFMFSGKGSQYYHMGYDLYQTNPIFRKHVLAIDKVIFEITGFSTLGVIYEKNKSVSEPFCMPIHATLSLYMIELAMVKTLNEIGVFADVLLGASFGTLVASVVSNCIDEREAIDLFIRQDLIFSTTCEDGCMLGVVADSDIYQLNKKLQSVADLAGINFSNHFVISLPMRNWEWVSEIFARENVIYQKLAVSRAFHSRWVDSAKSDYLDLYKNVGSVHPTIPVICISRKSIVPGVNSDVLWQAVRGSMNLYETVSQLEKSGPHFYIDVGPSGTLSTFLKYILSSSSKSYNFPILTPFKKARDNIEKILFTVRA